MGAHGTIRVALAFAALLASLTLVVWRQGRALDALRALDHTRSERAVAESERAELLGRIQFLESRARVVRVAAQRLGMRVPAAGEEMTILLRGPGGDAARVAGGVPAAEERGR
jgi:cell division protein FtsL